MAPLFWFRLRGWRIYLAALGSRDAMIKGRRIYIDVRLDAAAQREALILALTNPGRLRGADDPTPGGPAHKLLPVFRELGCRFPAPPAGYQAMRRAALRS